MSRCIAIPVVQGDAFYLEREGFSVLTDGGRSRSAFPSMFQAVTRTNRVNVIICTHNDADHANGILGFIETGLRCDEVWLPGRWLSTLPNVLNPFVEVIDELVENIAETAGSSNMKTQESRLSRLEAYAECVRDPEPDVPSSEEGPTVAANGWPESYVQLLEQAEPWEVLPHRLRPWYYKDCCSWWYRHCRRLDLDGVKLLWSSMDAAARIRAIATETFHRGIPVRWFEFDTAAPSGGVSALQPINARAIARVRTPVGPLLDWLALTVSNKESLVFWSPLTYHHPGVLFTADSDLRDVDIPSQLDGAIVTAPHHGSEANAYAYLCQMGTQFSTQGLRQQGRAILVGF